jgi:ABC-type lipoprotein export system ATPase subunit
MKQRLIVSHSLVNKPDILFLDKPTEGLDPTSAKTIRTIIWEKPDPGATVFFPTHDMLEPTCFRTESHSSTKAKSSPSLLSRVASQDALGQFESCPLFPKRKSL